jgi:glycosyltransferase involved in cell wall biosynthesis
MVAPLNIARGTQNKILEAMAMGVPVVTSRIAAGGVDAEPGVHLLTADSLSEQVEAITKLLESPAERQRLAVAGRERMLTHHSWKSSMKRLDGIIERCVGEFTGQPLAA